MNLFDTGAGMPYVSTLRIFQPYSAFGPSEQRAIVAEYPQAATNATQYEAGQPPAVVPAAHLREELERREVTSALRRMMRAGGDPYPGTRSELIRRIKDPANRGHHLYCPNQAVLRSAVSAELLREELSEPQARVLIPQEYSTRHSHRLKALVDAGVIESEHLYSRSSTWGVPFAWFVFFHENDPADVVAHHSGSIATVRVHVALSRALERARSLTTSLSQAVPELDFLEELIRVLGWADHFHAGSVIELDYGAAADMVFPDESPTDVRLAIECITEGDLTGAAAAYHRLTTRWSPVQMLGSAS